MSLIQVKDINNIRVITINRPEKKNAINFEMYDLLTQALQSGEQDLSINTFVLQGQIDCFTSGNDLTDFLSHSQKENAQIDQHHPAFNFLFTLLDLTKPIIAAVTGLAIGIGTTILLHCDLIYSGPNTQFQLPFVKLSLSPEAGASQLLPQIVGQTRANELLMLGEPFSAQQALDDGLINKIIETELVFQFAFTQAEKLASQPQIALAATKQLIKYNKEEIREQMKKELIIFDRLLKSKEAKEIFAKFLRH
ncbi:enoyl-CoA hydratase-related protein [Vibrio sp. SS-MA-C1-2]|uniref:enoyl-CoA hydratase-related protein n=1 Tax=Vibrio sp. SS-MA-C1-2 TaxID=2908646 RepID=UPI001F171038|nr:enoyl-CoA hydratase-related protein [Vibrio sp. SS-MA-C1-2]UJF19939.1 enoyl-CoA hydratase-related protein [Vibrio sp. SS-MA-C1-2]